jgi:2-oxoglutarate dehydrogenase E1 component
MIATYRNAMDKGLHTNTTILSNYKPSHSIDWAPFVKTDDWREPYDSKVPLKTIKASRSGSPKSRGVQARIRVSSA